MADFLNALIEFLKKLLAILQPPVEPPPVEPPPVEPPPSEPAVTDVKWGILKSRRIENGLTLAGKFTPAVVQIQDRPVADGRKGAPIPVLAPAMEYIAKINDAQGLQYAQSVGKMWINSAYADGETPKAESISVQHNYVSWDKEQSGCAKLRCFKNTESFPFDPALVNWQTRSDLFFKAQATNLDNTKYILVGADISCYLPLMSRSSGGGTGELWLALDEIEPFPQLPVVVTVLPEFPGTHLNVRDKPNGLLVAQYLSGEPVVVLEYRTTGTDVWGRTSKGWICLRMGNEEFTTWHLDTPCVVY